MLNRPRSSSNWQAAVVMVRFAWAANRRQALLAFGIFALEALVLTLFAFWLKQMIDGIAIAATNQVLLAAGGLALAIAGGSLLAYSGNRVRMRLAEEAHYLVEQRLIALVGKMPTLAIHETPAHLTQLEMLEGAWEFGEVIPSLINLCATTIRIVTTTVLLLSVHPLLLLLPLFGLPALLLSSKTSGLFQLGNELAAEPARRAYYLFGLATTADAAKELRLFRLGEALLARFHAASQELRSIHLRLNIQGELIGLATRLAFLVGYMGAIIFVIRRAIDGMATVGDAVLTAVLAGQVLGLIAASADLVQFTWRGLAAAKRFLYLEALAEQPQPKQAAQIPTHLQDGIRLENLSYCYPLREQLVLQGVNLHLPAGTTVAIVGDNGAGKTTLVKLLAGLYEPTTGQITVDGIDMATLDPPAWRQRIAAGFQDFARFEFLVRESVGIGDLAALDNNGEDAVLAALNRAGAADLLSTLPHGLATQLGPNWPNGIDLSGGQWQKLAIGRALMRTSPLLLLLDEPTAALDAETEHHLFSQWTSTAHALRQATGAVTVLVSHRFSTVQMADLIVVLNGGQIVEEGSHSELMARNGLYAELFTLQAQSYR